MYLYSICGCSTAVHCVGYIVIFSMLYRQWNLCSSEETKCASRRRHRLLRCTEASRHRLLRCTKVSRHRLLRCTEVSRRRLLKCTEIEFQIRNYVECLQDADCGIILCALVLFVSCHYSMCSAIDLTAFPFVRWCIFWNFSAGFFPHRNNALSYFLSKILHSPDSTVWYVMLFTDSVFSSHFQMMCNCSAHCVCVLPG